MFKALLPWKHKHNKNKVMAADKNMSEEVIIQQQNLQPCQVCGRTFLPTPLRKHEKICQKNASKKRKVFNSLKQRVEGTEFAAFHINDILKPTEALPLIDRKIVGQSKWKEKHMELVKAIRAARGTNENQMSPKKSTSSLTAGNERCPSCSRQFGPKAFDRHVEWCKEHKARIHQSPVNQQAKERLEARTKYRVPLLNKSKRSLTRDKYSPGSTCPTPDRFPGSSCPSTPVESVKSMSSISLSRNPSIRKQKSTNALLGKNQEETRKKLDKRDDLKLKISSPNQEKFIPSIASASPKAESVKSVTKKKSKPKINTVEINDSIGLISVTSLSNTESNTKKLVTWKDTIKNKNSIEVIKEVSKNILKKNSKNIIVNNLEFEMNQKEKKQFKLNEKELEKYKKYNNVDFESETTDVFLENSNYREVIQSRNDAINLKNQAVETISDNSNENQNKVLEKCKMGDLNPKLIDLKAKDNVISTKTDKANVGKFNRNCFKKSLSEIDLSVNKHKEASINKKNMSLVDVDLNTETQEDTLKIDHLKDIRDNTNLENPTKEEKVIYNQLIKLCKGGNSVKNIVKKSRVSRKSSRDIIGNASSEDTIVLQEEDSNNSVNVLTKEIQEIIRENNEEKLKNSDHCKMNNWFESVSEKNNDNEDLEVSYDKVEVFCKKEQECEQEVENKDMEKLKIKEIKPKQQRQKIIEDLRQLKVKEIKSKEYSSMVEEYKTIVVDESFSSSKSLSTNSDLIQPSIPNINGKDLEISSIEVENVCIKNKEEMCRGPIVNVGIPDTNIERQKGLMSQSVKSEVKTVKKFTLPSILPGNGVAQPKVTQVYNKIKSVSAGTNKILEITNTDLKIQLQMQKPTFIIPSIFPSESKEKNKEAQSSTKKLSFPEKCHNIEGVCKDKALIIFKHDQKDITDAKYNHNEIPNFPEENINFDKLEVCNEEVDIIYEEDEEEVYKKLNSDLEILETESKKRNNPIPQTGQCKKVVRARFSLPKITASEKESTNSICKQKSKDNLSKSNLDDVDVIFKSDQNLTLKESSVDIEIEKINQENLLNDESLKIIVEKCGTPMNSPEDDVDDFETSNSSNHTYIIDRSDSEKINFWAIKKLGDVNKSKSDTDIIVVKPNSCIKHCKNSNAMTIKNSILEIDIHRNGPLLRYYESISEEESFISIYRNIANKSSSKSESMESLNNEKILIRSSISLPDLSEFKSNENLLIDCEMNDETSFTNDVESNNENFNKHLEIFKTVSERKLERLKALDLNINNLKLESFLDSETDLTHFMKMDDYFVPKKRRKLDPDEQVLDNIIELFNCKNRVILPEDCTVLKSTYDLSNKKTLVKVDEDTHNSSSNYDPFESAQRQFMELLECDEFKPFKATAQPVQHTPRPTNLNIKPKTPIANKKLSPISPIPVKKGSTLKPLNFEKNLNEKNVKNEEKTPKKRASVIDPPSKFKDFKDSMESINDDFELLENMINDNFPDDNTLMSNSFFLHDQKNDTSLNLDSILNSRIYSDDLNSIDPRLINENDNLSIPDNFPCDDLSPTSTVDTDITIRNEDVDEYSLEFDNLIKNEDTNIKNSNLVDALLVTKLEKRSINNNNNSSSNKPSLQRSVSLLNRSNSVREKVRDKSVSSAKVTGRKAELIIKPKPKPNNCSANKPEVIEKKKGLPTLKKSMTLFDPVAKPPQMKNKEDVDNYFSEQEQKSNGGTKIPTEKVFENKMEGIFKPEELFSVDNEMFEEYKKYEEMYLLEKQQQSQSKRQKPKVELNYGILTASEDEQSPLQVNKISNDSAYGSLQRKTSKHRSRSAKLAPLEQKNIDSTSSSGSENCPNSPAPVGGFQSQRYSKFCHECGNKYPVTSAKFCPECGVKRLAL